MRNPKNNFLVLIFDKNDEIRQRLQEYFEVCAKQRFVAHNFAVYTPKCISGIYFHLRNTAECYILIDGQIDSETRSEIDQLRIDFAGQTMVVLVEINLSKVPNGIERLCHA